MICCCAVDSVAVAKSGKQTDQDNTYESRQQANVMTGLTLVGCRTSPCGCVPANLTEVLGQLH